LEVSQLLHWSSVCAVVAPSTGLDLNFLTVLIRSKYGSKRKRLDFIKKLYKFKTSGEDEEEEEEEDWWLQDQVATW
jgi:hypothetical protein